MDAGMSVVAPGRDRAGGGWALAAVLAATLLARSVDLDQPIVENYVGRQVPTAMVAVNLERGSGLLFPRLDTAPAPNYFLVEPPLYQWGVVALRRVTGLGMGAAGRMLSAMATAAAAWGTFELSRRRAGRRAALLAAGALAAFPLTIRYGRAFQPDAAMLGAVAAGLACWDRSREIARDAARRAWFAAGWGLLALGFAIKIIAAPLLLLPVFAEPRGRRLSGWLAIGATLVPALLWYTWAAYLAASGGGSRASADNGAIWLGLLAPSSLWHPESWEPALWFVAVRAFTPIGAALALFGLIGGRGGIGFWRTWGLVSLATLAMLASKLHHEYYFLMLAPAAAAGVGLALDRLAEARRGRLLVPSAASCLLALAVVQARSTWRTPPEWTGLEAAARAVAGSTPADAWVVAPEALLFESDRRGCRLEWTAAAARRAAGEWGAAAGDAVRGPIDLVDYYRRRGARYFADLGDRPEDPRRLALHDAVRRRYKVIIDRPEVLIADLESVPVAGMLPHAN
jgi:4-amino-4-deoxy-L-arabinose transferase-like glycosyltransferase